MSCNWSRSIGCAIALAMVGLYVGGCGGPRPGPGGETGETSSGEIQVDAYLFDAQLRRDGKPTSVRLEIYQTDSLIGLSGRGYLGKGALRGRLTADSLLVYFPSTNEYFDEPVERILETKGCVGDIPDLPLASLLTTLPDSMSPNPFEVMADYDDSDRPAFSITAEGCPWKIDITYDRDDDVFRVREFEFDNGSNTRLKGSRRELKHGVTISLSRFSPRIPSDAVRLTR